MDTTKSRTGPALFLALAQGVIGWEWLHAGYEKLSDSAFAAGMPKTIAVFAGKNPHTTYQSFLQGTVAPNAGTFATLVSWGEFFAGIGLIVGAVALMVSLSGRLRLAAQVISITALAGGALMSLNFYYAAGYLSASTDSVNMVMGWTQVILGAALVTELVHQRATTRVTTPKSIPRVSGAAA